MSLEFIEKFSKNKLKPRKNESKLDCAKRTSHLYFDGRNVAKIGDLTACHCLKVLYFHNNFIEKIENLTANLSTVTHLYLQWNHIKSMENFDCMNNLKKLYLGHNEIQELTGLSHMKSLEQLHIERQRLPPNIEFQFDLKCLENISRSLLIFNISKLNLSTIKPIECLYRLEKLYATDNPLTSAKETGASLGCLISLQEVDLLNCPAQKETHYREHITASTNKLQTLDGKVISNHARNFIKRFQKMKSEKSNQAPDDTRLVKAVQPPPMHTRAMNMLKLSQDEEVGSINYQAWMSLAAGKKKPQKKNCPAMARICSAQSDLEGDTLQGTTVVNKQN